MYKQNYSEELFPVPETQVVDVCGAGDTFLAALTYQYLKSGDIKTSITFANRCASIAVRHRGVYCLTKSDISSII
jgi:sugar/nucleoside kinase (ribokinase family)